MVLNRSVQRLHQGGRMPGVTQSFSRRRFCASMLAAAAGILAAACSRRVGLNPALPTSHSPAKAPLTFPHGFSWGCRHVGLSDRRCDCCRRERALHMGHIL